MGIFADIEKLITEHGSAAILREKVGLLELQRTQALERATLAESKAEALERENANLKAQIPEQKLDVCPFCNRPGGVLKKRGRHAIFGEAGVYTHNYQCSCCGKEYDKDVDQ